MLNLSTPTWAARAVPGSGPIRHNWTVGEGLSRLKGVVAAGRRASSPRPAARRAAPAGSETTGRPSLVKRMLMTLMVIGAMGTAVGAGTFASFTSQTTNASSTFSTGTLALGNQKDTGRICLSTNGGDLTGSTYDTLVEPNTISGGTPASADTSTNSATCDTVLSALKLEPGDTTTVNITIANVGDLAGNLTAAIPSCSGAVATDQVYFTGTADICPILEMSLQEYASIPKRTSADTSGGYCWYGASTGYDTACSTTGALLASFSTTGLSLQDTGQSPYQTTAAGGVRVFKLTIGVPASAAANQNYQGRKATFSLNWTLTSA